MERVEGISCLRQGKSEVRQPMDEVQAGLGELVRHLTSNDPEDRPTAASMLEQQFSEKDLVLLDSGREAKVLRDQVFSCRCEDFFQPNCRWLCRRSRLLHRGT